MPSLPLPQISLQEEVTEGWHLWVAEVLRAELGREGCPFCILVLSSVQPYIGNWRYDGFNDIEHCRKVIRQLGFCPMSIWQIVRQQHTFTLAFVYRAMFSDLLDGFA